MNKRTAELSFIVIISILLSACASSVNVDYDQKFIFSDIRSFEISNKPASNSGDVRLDTPFVAKRIITAIENELSGRGYIHKQGGANVRVVFHVDKRTGIETRSSGMMYGVAPYGRYGGFGMAYGYPGYDVESYEEGVLTIDIVDSKQNTLIWRGSGSRRLYGGSTPEKSTKTINEVVAEILAKFPPETTK